MKLFLLSLVAATTIFGQTYGGGLTGGVGNQSLRAGKVSDLPAIVPPNWSSEKRFEGGRYVRDGATTTDCTIGGGTNYVLCFSDGVTYHGFSAAGGSTLTASGVGASGAASANKLTGPASTFAHLDSSGNGEGLTPTQTATAISAVTTTATSTQSLASPTNIPTLNGVIQVNGANFTSFGSALTYAKTLTGNQKILVGPGLWTETTQQVLPDNGQCVDIEAAGKGVATIQLQASIGANAFFYKGPLSPTLNCAIKNVTIDANGNAAYGIQALVGKGWIFDQVAVLNATTENWAIGDYLGQARSTVALASITRSGNTNTMVLASTPAVIIGTWVVISGVTGDTSFNAPCSNITYSGTGTTYTCRQVGSNSTSGVTGSVTVSNNAIAFYEFNMRGDRSEYSTSLFTAGSQPAYGFHFYPLATDGGAVSDLVSINARVASIKTEGTAAKIRGAHGYGFPEPAWSQSYTVEDSGTQNTFEQLESDTPLLADFHFTSTLGALTGSYGFSAAHTKAIRQAGFSNIPISVQEPTATAVTVKDTNCSGNNAGFASQLYQFNTVTSAPDAASFYGFVSGCSGFGYNWYNGAHYSIGPNPHVSYSLTGQGNPVIVVAPNVTTQSGVSVQYDTLPTADPYHYAVKGDTVPREGAHADASHYARYYIGSVNTVASSATPAFNLALGTYQTNTLTANITSFTISNVAVGGRWCFDFPQNATGNFTIAGVPAAVHGFFSGNSGQPGTTASKHNVQCFYSPDGTNLYAESGGLTNQ